MPGTKVFYYISPKGQNPVREFLHSLPEKPRAKLSRITETIEKYGLISVLPHVKKLSGTPLWEIRVLGKDNIRVIYAAVKNNNVLLLHGFIKKTQKTPPKEIQIASTRLHQWNQPC